MDNRNLRPPSRIPLPLKHAFERMNIERQPTNLERSLDNTRVQRQQLQDFRPLYRSLEWELSDHAWNSLGVLPFAENNVPFIVTNSGRLSEHAAALLFESCKQSPPGPELRVLELGAGTGLFARLLLDSFRAICQQHNTDYYDKLAYTVSDRSQRSIDQWRERGLFEQHQARVDLKHCDAHRLADDLVSGRLRAVFCNYVLDVLPSTVIRSTGAGVEELQVRTHLISEPTIVAQHTTLTPAEIAGLAESPDPDRRRQLQSLVSLLELETAFRPLSEEPSSCIEHAVEMADGKGRIVVNFGAMQCLETSVRRLDQDGFVLLNDYGLTSSEEMEKQVASQRFGPTLALGINFPLLGSYLEMHGYYVALPDNDADAAIHSRLITANDLPALTEFFNNRLGSQGHAHFERPLNQAREHAAAGRKDEALEAYKTALTNNRSDWYVIGEIAEYVGLHLNDPAAGMALAQEAVALNPWYSPWLWNVLGDCLFCQDRYQDAHEAYLQAHRIDPRDVRTNLNLAFTHTELADQEAALSAIGRGLAHDRIGLHREQLLEKQRQIVSGISARALAEQERLARRALSQW